MIRIELDDATLHRTRVAISPLWESLSSLALLARFRGDAPSPYTQWARHARKALPGGIGEELAGWLGSPGVRRLPTFLTPLPETPRPSFASELDALRAADAAWLSRELDQQPAAVSQRFAAGPSALAQFADRLAEYWEAAIAPYWSSMSSALEEEILIRGRTLATDGPAAMLGELGGRVIWQPPVLAAPYPTDSSHILTDSAFTLVPVIFGAGTRVFAQDSTTAGLSYQARGAGVLEITDSGAATGSLAADRMATLIGRGRAAVIRSLEHAPTTTTALAKATGLAPSTVSEHLSALVVAGVVRRHRVGARVLYELDTGGQLLMAHLDDGDR